MLDMLTLGQQSGSTDAAIIIVQLVIQLAILILVFASFWKIFTKAGVAGWLGIIPIVNMYFLFKIAGKPGWLVIGMFIPLVNIILAFYLGIVLAKAFGKGVLFGIGLTLLGIVFYPILAFGSAEYQGPQA